MGELVLRAVAEFEVDCSRLHNDSSSVKLQGVYAFATGGRRGGKKTLAAAYGFSKDHRPDLKQLVWILTVAADGAVPLLHRVTDGNTEDSTTHIATWDALCALLGRRDFLYVADAKLAVRQTMAHIDRLGRRFVSVLPRNRKEDEAMRDWFVAHEPEWKGATLSARPPPARRAGRLQRLRRPLAVFGGLPGHLGALVGEGGARRRGPPRAHRFGHRRLGRHQRPALLSLQ